MRKDDNNITPVPRRHFLSNTIKLILLGSLLPLEEACKSKTKSIIVPPVTKRKNKAHSPKKNNRRKWNYEGLVMNTKTKVLHLPTSRIYTYYDEIKPAHLQAITMAAWSSQLQQPVRFHKEQSGNILEILSLRELANGINEQSLTMAKNVLVKSFDSTNENSKGINPNIFNFRLHELMLQLITLNNSIAADARWSSFLSSTKRPPQLRKRQKWMETETAFYQRVNYIQQHQNDYISRLQTRAAKYNFT
jgi:hypothetical protein